MILPKLISIDTSIFGDLTRDYFSQNKKRSEIAHKTIAHLIEEGLVPFLSFHHIQEILQHQDSDVVFERWSLIKKFLIVAWVCSFNDDNVLGSIFDVHQIEIKLILDNPNNGPARLIEEIKIKYIKYISGDEFVDKFEPLYYEIRDMGIIDVQRGKEIESLSHIRSKEVDNCRLSDLFKSRKNPELSACLGNIVKLSNYSELIAIGG